MNVVRISMSHANHAYAQAIINHVKKLNKNEASLTNPIGILIDTQGPEIRTGISQSDIDLKVGEIVNLTIRDDIDVETSSIKINYKGLVKNVEKGQRLALIMA